MISHWDVDSNIPCVPIYKHNQVLPELFDTTTNFRSLCFQTGRAFKVGLVLTRGCQLGGDGFLDSGLSSDTNQIHVFWVGEVCLTLLSVCFCL
jgi:hypothetical protein